MTQADYPLYVQIAEQIRRSIKEKTYAVGQRLPAEGQLSERFGVNRHTLRQAIGLLKQEGLLRIERGKGTFVAAAPIRYPIGKRVRYNEALKAQGHVVRFELVRAAEVVADEAIAEGLSVGVGDSVAMTERLGFADDMPISVGTGYFPLALFPDILSAESTKALQSIGSVSKWLRTRYDIDHIRRSTSVSARLVEPADAKLLRLPLNQPVLLAESVNVDREGRIIEYGVAKLRGDRMEMFFENVL